jgi:hypothetical protein
MLLRIKSWKRFDCCYIVCHASLLSHVLTLQTAKYIAVLCINLCRVLDLEVIILGGGMAQAGEDLLSRVKDMISANTWTVLPTNVRICLAQVIHHTGG